MTQSFQFSDQYRFNSRRSMVIAREGMVATSQPLASQWGLDILKAGGNAVDAAIATAAALCVVEPCSTGIGGDAFSLIWWADEQKLYGLNASGPCPSNLTSEWLRSQGFESMPAYGPHTVTVPGSLRGWEAVLDRFGTLSLKQLLTRPIDYAHDGFPVSSIIARSWLESADLLSQSNDSKRVWLPGGRAPMAAETYRNPAIAATFKTLANDGIEVFYSGKVGMQIVECVRSEGGFLALDDLSSYQAEWVDPISLDYRDGFTFHEIPPNGQGLTALMALNIVSGIDITALEYTSPDRWHILIEATKLAFADASAYIADPRMRDVPTLGLLDENYARDRRDLIDLDHARIPSHGHPPSNGDTVYLTVVDSAGNMVSWIQSLYKGFGSGLTAGTTGIQLQNRGANFSLTLGHPNELYPGKRPYHTIIPGFITHNGQPWCSFGVMGGFMQPQGHLQVGVNLVDYMMDPQTALDAPRFRWLGDNRVALESDVPEEIRTELVNRGHDVIDQDRDSSFHFGGGQIIMRDPASSVLVGGSDSRKDGSAVGW